MTGSTTGRTVVAVVALGRVCGFLAGCGASDAASAPAPVPPSFTVAPGGGMPGGGMPYGGMRGGMPHGGTDPSPAAADGRFAGEEVPAQVQELQRAVDAGHMPWRADPAAVAGTFARMRLGWNDPRVVLSDPHTAAVTSPSHGGAVSMQLVQPARPGAGGVWFVTGGTWTR